VTNRRRSVVFLVIKVDSSSNKLRVWAVVPHHS
jgi:hypothetical protein